MIEVYHNPRCSKSREVIETLNDSKAEYKIIYYLEKRLTITQLKKVIRLLKISPKELIRTNEPIWKDQFKNKSLSDIELITIMVQHPKLIERPIIINGNKAIIGRPPSKILNIL